jgi:4-amino-4-deoxy-L-arabinose transferase-like glycosyltransferase
MSKEILIRIGIIAACLLFFSFKAGDVGTQFTGDENFYFQSSKNMLESGDWLTPRYYGKPRFQKPILYYWFVAASFTAFGVEWYAARFPSILFGALAVLLVYLIGQMVFRERSYSLLSAFILASTFKFFKYTRFAIPDMALLFFMSFSLYIFMKIIRGGRDNRMLWIALFFITALGTITKGPIAVIIPALTIIIFTIFSKARIPVKGSDILLGGALYIAVILPWFLIMYRLHGTDFLSHIWIREISERVGYHSVEGRGIARFAEYIGTYFFYIPIVIVKFLPWSLFLPMGMIYSFSAAKSDKDKRHGYILLLSWFFAIFTFFTIMGEKHSQYMLSLTPPFALLTGAGFLLSPRFSKKGSALPVVLLLITVLSFLSFLSKKDFRLNNAILGGFASKILDHGLDDQDKIGAGSHELIPQQLEVYLDRPVEKIGRKWYDPAENRKTNKKKLENFFKSGTIYCIISSEDFDTFVSPGRKKQLKVIYKDLLWKRKIEFTKEKFFYLLRGRIDLLKAALKREYCLVTNK